MKSIQILLGIKTETWYKGNYNHSTKSIFSVIVTHRLAIVLQLIISMRYIVSILIAYSSIWCLTEILCPESISAEPLNLLSNEICTDGSYVPVFLFILLEIQVSAFQQLLRNAWGKSLTRVQGSVLYPPFIISFSEIISVTPIVSMKRPLPKH